jgi:hypothetical protein
VTTAFKATPQQEFSIIFVGFWRWRINIKRIVFLDFIHRLVSQEQRKLKQLKIIDKILKPK